MAMAEPDANLDDLLEEQASLQTKIEDADAWNVKVLALTLALALCLLQL